MTLLEPDAGRASVLGLDVVKKFRQLRQRVGYMAGRFSLYPDLSVEENLRFFASVFGTTIEQEYSRIAPIYSQLEPFKARRAAALSGGMKQKLALCCALVHRPEILVLDEPTTGVDAVSRREFWELLGTLQAERPDGCRLDAVHGRSQPLRSNRPDSPRSPAGGGHARRHHSRASIVRCWVFARATATRRCSRCAATNTRTACIHLERSSTTRTRAQTLPSNG